MKKRIYICCLLLVLVSCGNSSNEKSIKTDRIIQEKDTAQHEKGNSEIDSLKASKSEAIIEGRLLNFEGGDKYYYSTISVQKVVRNKTNHKIGDTIRVAYYNWGAGIPKDKECILYIVPWPLGSSDLNENGDWMLIEGDGESACDCK